MRPIVPPVRVKLADRWRVSLREGDGLDTRSWKAGGAADVLSKSRRYEDILSGLRLMLTRFVLQAAHSQLLVCGRDLYILSHTKEECCTFQTQNG